MVEVEKEANVKQRNVKKNLVVDLNEEDPKSQEGDEKEPMISEEMVDEEVDPKVVENDEPQSDPMPTMKVPFLFLHKLKKKEDNAKFKTILAKLNNLSVNIPLLEAIQEIPSYHKLMKNLMLKKCLVDGETIEVTPGCRTIMTSVIMEKKEDLGAFIIPCTVGTYKFEKDLCELGASINLMPYSSIEDLVWALLQ
ncbi:uncharacterized protein LOC107879083 [Capsicum annuum]|uniref:uncharacterized protein LOC107879083 n=1 Tax=Capsicum annuum TaxID=4072 RepID=UPI0007BF849F|nr:uncharacterized protein LOC107879083 [Capsicum annuum]